MRIRITSVQQFNENNIKGTVYAADYKKGPAADAVVAWAREGTSKAANRFNSFELQAPAEALDGPAPGEVGGPPDDSGVRRTRTGWRRILGLGGEPDDRSDNHRR